MIQAPLSMSDLTPVLLVEDDMGDAALTRAILCGDDSSQFELTHVRSLQEALGQFSLNEYHVVLLDLNLPDSRGLKTVQEFLQADSNTPIIVLSGQDDEAMAIESVQVGAQDYILKGDTSGRHLRRSIRYAIERKRTELELSRLALYDELTGLPSRTLLRDRWNGVTARAQRSKCWTAVLMIDLNKFKAINDTHGHLAGDRVLQEVAKRVTARLRGGDTVSRFGGDEFVILLENIRNRNDADKVASKVRAVIQEPMNLGFGSFTVTASVGLAVSHNLLEESLEHVIEMADRDMYARKNVREAETVQFSGAEE